jgi:pyruvate/2-oxoglutarate dehydrogenase complex dihydrolipoamide dehydrogenase (E3) component
MPQTINTDICVIGAGSAGLSVAAGASQLGARTVLIEADRMGGDCLNTGCVPSKALLAAAKAAHLVETASIYGVGEYKAKVDFKAVHDYVHGVIASIAPHDSAERFRNLGCTVLREHARFIDKRTVQAGNAYIRARRFVVATGSRPTVPPIPGIKDVSALTNETIFDLTELPRHLLVIGAGPIGCEMAQAFRRLGATVTLLEKASMLPKDDLEAAAVVRASLQAEGVNLIEGTNIERIEKTSDGIAIIIPGPTKSRIEGSHLLVATGRKPNTENLDLEKAGIKVDRNGIEVDLRLRTSNSHVFAAGDVIGGPQFTHVANYHAGIIIRNALFRLPAKINLRAIPWVTFTDPELAQIGMTEAEAHNRHGDSIRVVKIAYADIDRARTEQRTEGFAKVITDRRSRILGATIVGARAGELIQTWGLAISHGLKISAVANMIAPYPVFGEINKRVAGKYYAPTLFSRRTRVLVRSLGLFG